MPTHANTNSHKVSPVSGTAPPPPPPGARVPTICQPRLAGGLPLKKKKLPLGLLVVNEPAAVLWKMMSALLPTVGGLYRPCPSWFICASVAVVLLKAIPAQITPLSGAVKIVEPGE